MEFDVEKTAIGGELRFNGCEIHVSPAAIKVSMWEYLQRLTPVLFQESGVRTGMKRRTKKRNRHTQYDVLGRRSYTPSVNGSIQDATTIGRHQS